MLLLFRHYRLDKKVLIAVKYLAPGVILYEGKVLFVIEQDIIVLNVVE